MVKSLLLWFECLSHWTILILRLLSLSPWVQTDYGFGNGKDTMVWRKVLRLPVFRWRISLPFFLTFCRTLHTKALFSFLFNYFKPLFLFTFLSKIWWMSLNDFFCLYIWVISSLLWVIYLSLCTGLSWD